MVKKDIKDFYFIEDLDNSETRKNVFAIDIETRIGYRVDIRDSDIVTLPNAKGLVFATKKDIEIASVISDISKTFFELVAKKLDCEFIVDKNNIDNLLKFNDLVKKYRFIRESDSCLGYFIDQSGVDLFVFAKEDDTPRKICYKFQFEFFYQIEKELGMSKEQINQIENEMKKTLLKYN